MNILDLQLKLLQSWTAMAQAQTRALAGTASTFGEATLRLWGMPPVIATWGSDPLWLWHIGRPAATPPVKAVAATFRSAGGHASAIIVNPFVLGPAVPDTTDAGAGRHRVH